MPENAYIFVNWSCGLILAAVVIKRLAGKSTVAKYLFSPRLRIPRLVILAAMLIVAAGEFLDVGLYEPMFLRAEKGDPIFEPPIDGQAAPEIAPRPPKSLDFAEYWLGASDLRLGNNIYRDMAEYIHHKSLEHKREGREIPMARFADPESDSKEGFVRLDRMARENGIPLFPHFTYPPTWYLLFVPFTYLDWRDAHDLWLILNLLFVAASIALIACAIGYRPRIAEETLAVLTLILGFSPLIFALKECQANSLVLLIISASIYFAARGNEAPAGALLALGAAIKIFPGILIAYFLWTRRFKLAAWAIGVLIAILLISIAAAGWEMHSWYFFKVIPTWASNIRAFDMNQSVAGVIARTLVGGEGITPIAHSPRLARVAIWAAQILLLGLAMWFTRGKRERIGDQVLLEIGLMIVLYQLASTWVLIHHLQWLLVPFLIVWGLAARGAIKLRRGLLLSFCASYLLVGIKYIYYRAEFRAGPMALMASLKCLGALLLFASLILLIRSLRAGSSHSN
ncbi:DUF2029 domain-containing protein [bacterium]|nr:DUF2029 domain-containing protein [bacterium]